MKVLDTVQCHQYFWPNGIPKASITFLRAPQPLLGKRDCLHSPNMMISIYYYR